MPACPTCTPCFQRALVRAHAEVRPEGRFLSWRELMYALARLTPDDVEAIATQL